MINVINQLQISNFDITLNLHFSPTIVCDKYLNYLYYSTLSKTNYLLFSLSVIKCTLKVLKIHLYLYVII